MRKFVYTSAYRPGDTYEDPCFVWTIPNRKVLYKGVEAEPVIQSSMNWFYPGLSLLSPGEDGLLAVSIDPGHFAYRRAEEALLEFLETDPNVTIV